MTKFNFTFLGLLEDKFRTLKKVPKENWEKGLLMPPQDALTEYNCKLLCWSAHNASCYGLTFDHLAKSCYILDITRTDSTIDSMAIKGAHDVHIIKNYAEAKGCPSGYTHQASVNKCYMWSDEEIFMGPDCNGYCAQHNGILAEPRNADEDDAIRYTQCLNLEGNRENVVH